MDKTLTEGKISKNIILFAIPIFLGNLFQQLYSIVDSLVVGNVLGKDALAAVSSSGSLIFLITGFINGIFVGAGVIIARYYGAKNWKDLSIAVHTTIAFGIIAGIIVTAAGMCFTPWMLKMMGTPADVLPNSILYFRLYFAGGLGIVMYNTCMGIFQAVGDSRHPLYYLIISSILNVILELLFVAVLGLGIGGSAIATVIAQFVSAILGFAKLLRVEGRHRVHIKEIQINKEMLINLLKMGIPTGIQNSVIAFANVIVQTNINAFGSVAMAGCGSYSKLEGFAFLPITSFSVSLTTFIGQNLGAKQYERAKKGARFGILTGVLLAESVGIILWLLAPILIRFFNNQPDVIAFGVMQTRTEAIFYCLLALSHCLAGILRGAGKTSIPMIVMLICWCAIRITYISIIIKLLPYIQVVFWAYPLTWFLSSVIFIIYYKKADWIHSFSDI
ncbi:MATE family efflux transporter [Anaerocolumna sp. AGMB13025]|uniref:MATE family efflux transporter n=1 Tax=Anaerocolumna sp. AGMB13025 TaxID=3039116 RepID=UPI00241F10CA|nr:MATE family efflux transporter [Anaerocolumna sp. AGMB13025]WFR60110.1 MATE family efflux transporter [Anaerocolumna sp. AGMB13025]